MAKGTSMRKTIGKDERTTAAMWSMRSVFFALTKEIAEAIEVFVQRKNTNVDATPCYAGKTHNETVLCVDRNFFTANTERVEMSHCRSFLSKDNHLKMDRNNELANLLATSQSRSRPRDANEKVTIVTVAPLLVDKIQFGKLAAAQAPRAIQELGLTNMATMLKTGTRKLTEALRELEQPNWKAIQVTMNEDKKTNSDFSHLNI